MIFAASSNVEVATLAALSTVSNILAEEGT